MPEGDTIHASAARVRRALGSGPVQMVAGAKLGRAGARLVGSEVTTVWSHGKHLMIELGPWTVRAHLGMHGKWTTHRPGGAPSATGRVTFAIETSHGGAACWLAPSVSVDRTPAVRQWIDDHLGPDLIREGAGPAIAARAREQGDRPIGEVLLDQRVAAGIGNVYKSELCFRAGIDPRTPVSKVADHEIEALYEDATHLLRLNSHRSDRLTTDDDRPGRRHWVYGLPGRGCRRCNTAIAGDAGAERVTFWCPMCQPPRPSGYVAAHA